MRGEITVITPSLPRRRLLLAEAIASVDAQTVPARHLIASDSFTHVSEKRNTLVRAASTEWVAFLDDDDVLDPEHLEILLEVGADVSASYCRFDGPAFPRPGCCEGYVNRPYDAEHLAAHNQFAITVLARREAVLDAGGFPWVAEPSKRTDPEDWLLWRAMQRAGASIAVVPKVTWTYRTKGNDRRNLARWRPPTTSQRRKQAVARRFRRLYGRYDALRSGQKVE